MMAHRAIDLDFGGSKLAMGCVSTIRKPLEGGDFQSCSHSLGFSLADPNISVHDAMEADSMNEVATFLSEYNPGAALREVHSHFFVATEPGRRAQEKSPGEFSKIFFEKTGFFPWVISGRLEAKIMAYALRSSASFSWKKLCQEPALLHVHPGSQSLELTLSSHGHATYGEKSFQGCEADLGFRRTEYSGGSIEDFYEYKKQIAARILASSDLQRIIEYSSQCGDIPHLAASGKASRKIIGRVLSLKGVAPKSIHPGSDLWLENSILTLPQLEAVAPKLLERLALEKDPVKLLGRKAEVYACAVLMNMLEIVSEKVREKGVFISDARLVYGINELRKMGSNDHYLIPEMCKDMSEEFFRTLIHSQYDSSHVSTTAQSLQGILTFLRGDEERHGLIHVALLHALGTLLVQRSHEGEYTNQTLSLYFGANRFPGMPRDTQEDILSAMLQQTPHNKSQNLVSGILRLISSIYSSEIPMCDISYGVLNRKLEVQIGSKASLHEFKTHSTAIDTAARQIGLEGVEFSFR